MSREMESLVRSQRELHGRIARAHENLRKVGAANITVGMVETRLQAMDENWHRFEKHHDALRTNYWEFVADHDYMKDDLYGVVEENYLQIRGRFFDLIAKLRNAKKEEPEDPKPPARQPARTTLPRIQLPEFSGKYEDWPAFRDLFTSIVGRDASITNVEKLHYLKTTLKGEAEQLVRNLTTTDDNFQDAWATLVERYENKRLLVRSYFSTLTSLQKMKGESVSDLKRIVHCMSNTVSSLKGIGRPISNCSDLFVHLLVELLDSRSRREWERSISGTTEPPEYESLKTFLERHVRTLEAVGNSKSDTVSTRSGSKGSENQPRSARALHAQKGAISKQCAACQKNHYVLFCAEYQKRQPAERKELVVNNKLCLNCLGNHTLAACTSKKTCGACNERHHTTLHDACVPTQQKASALVGLNASATATSHRAQPLSSVTSAVLLATARVSVTDRFGNKHATRALIDPGSEVSIVSEALAQRLRLPRSAASVAIYGVGGLRTGTAKGSFKLEVSSRITDESFTTTVLVLPRLTLYGNRIETVQPSWPHIANLPLADPEFSSNDPVHLLLGADVHASIIREGLRTAGPRAPMAQCTTLGWILSGLVGPTGADNNALSHQCVVDRELIDQVRRFWEQEEPPSSPILLTPDDKKCEEQFVQTHQRTKSGRYMVRLPRSPTLPPLRDTRHAAVRLLSAMEKKFKVNADFEEKYKAFMTEYEDLSHMTPVSPPTDATAPVCYLPHHGVLKESSTTTKLRVVFNGSQRGRHGEALNEHLLPGPNLLPALNDVLLRWRLHKYVFVSDIEKMYRQILVHSEDRDLQRIVWRQRADDAIQEYRLNTVTYGLTCAPFLAIRTLHQLATDEAERQPLGATLLRRDTYVDDIVTGAHTLVETMEMQRQLINVCTAGGFPLRKWAANDAQLLAGIPPEHRLQGELRTWESDQPLSTLGLQWHPREDFFCFQIKSSQTRPITKRTILSDAARLFDPLGWLAPVVVRAKIHIQSTWLQHRGWDDPLSEADASSWRQFQGELPGLAKIRVPRWMGTGAADSQHELHGFSDASERAYAAVVYLRTRQPDGTVTVSLLLAKTRVAPLKQVSVPRLELCAAALVAKLAAHVQTTLNMTEVPTYLWSDSTVALCWIQGHPTRWKTYVANRVAQIQLSLPQARWQHVMGDENPADCASRGLLPSQLLNHPLWWQGPEWLRATTASWPLAPPQYLDEPPEMRVNAHALASVEEESLVLLRFSSLQVLLRTTAWCRRWLHCVQPKSRATRGTMLEVAELNEAHDVWVRVIQATNYAEEIAALSGTRPLPSRSVIAKLRPFLDAQGILRVGGRLKHALLDYDERHPVILPGASHFSRLLVESHHRRTLHGGVQVTLASLRQRYWIPRGRIIVKAEIHKCITCVRWRAVSPQPVMGNLPGPRVTPSRPFQDTGVDYAGPMMLRTSKGRGQRAHKAFIAVFVCLSTRAVHIEIVSDYTAEAFLAAFRRFTSRRGLCRTLWSDCGTNFVGADKQLRELFRVASAEGGRIASHLATERVQWRFNPPAAPNFGGLWEAAVKAVKHHLRRVIGDTTLTFEEMSTFLTQVEACLNSRPLQALSDDPDDLAALTPGHFLIGAPMNAVPEPSLEDVSTTRLSRWQHLQKMRDHFWGRWAREYLLGLHARSKWWRDGTELRVGTLCLIRTESTPPTKWPLARVIRVHPGDDGHVRVATVRTAISEFTRPVNKLVPLPLESSADNE